jgi:hypothetical protein
MERILKSVSLFCFFSFLAVFNSLITAQTSSNDKELTQFLLDKMVENREKVKNYKCAAIYHEYEPKEAKQKILKQIREDFRKKGLPEKGLDQILTYEYTLRKHRLALDSQSRGRVEMLVERLDREGNLIVREKEILTWDGENAISYHENLEKAGSTAILSNEQPLETSKQYWHPWTWFGSHFCDALAEAIKEGTKINIERQQQAGTYRISLIYENDRKRIGVVDPNQGYSLTLEESYYGGVLINRDKAKFSKVSPGIWFPIEGEGTGFFMDDPKMLQYKRTVEVNEITINDPNFYDEGLFQVDFPEGTRVLDTVAGLKYAVDATGQPSFFYVPETDVCSLLSFIEAGKDTEAQALIDELIKQFSAVQSDLPEVLYHAAVGYEGVRNYDKAKSIYRQIIQKYPDSSSAKKAQSAILRIDALSVIKSLGK